MPQATQSMQFASADIHTAHPATAPKVGRTCGSAPIYKNERSDVFAAEPRTTKGVKRQIRLTNPRQCQDAPIFTLRMAHAPKER